MNVNETSINATINVSKEIGLSKEIHIFLIIINLLIVLFGLSGNIAVLYTSIRYKAIKIDVVSLFLLETLTLSDIVILFLYFVPMLTTLCGNKWVLGHCMCYITALFGEVPFYFQVMVKTAISCYRAWVCSKTTLFHPDKKLVNKFKVLTIMFAIVSLGQPACFLITNSIAIFAPQILRCVSSQYSRIYGTPAALKASTLLTVAFIAIPTFMIITTNLWTWYRVQKSHNKAHPKNTNKMILIKKDSEPKPTVTHFNKVTLMLTLVCCTFVLCYIPTVVKFVISMMGKNCSQFLYLFHNYLLSLNSIVNPFIYFSTNKTFRSFIQTSFKKNSLRIAFRKTKLSNI